MGLRQPWCLGIVVLLLRCASVATEEAFVLDDATILSRVSFLLYGYILVFGLMMAPWLVITCRAR